MEVLNPGRLMETVSIEGLRRQERFHASRNPRLVRVLVDLGYMRDQGEGIPRMFYEMEGSFLPDPELEETPHSFAVTLRNTLELSEADRRFIARLDGDELSQEEFRALLEARRHGQVDNASMRRIAGLDTLEASQLLRRLRDSELLELHSAGPASYYTLHPDISDRGGLEADRGGLEADRGGLRRDRGGLEADRGGLRADRGELTGEEREMVKNLGKRPRKEKLRKAILTLASRRAWRPSELAEVLGNRNARRLAERHLSPMYQEGLLERTNPENPSDPNQAYFAAEVEVRSKSAEDDG